MQWLDPQKDDIILDLGCGGMVYSPPHSSLEPHQPSFPDVSRSPVLMFVSDGILDMQIGEVLAQGEGSLHGIDGSEAMIRASKELAAKSGLDMKCTFEGA